jgi:glycosyltransferase involved in cell wall biosynthesis
MRILFLALDIELGLGRGDAVHPESLARALVARGHEVTLVAATSKLDPDALPTGLRVICVDTTSTLGQLASAFRIATAVRPDVIYERRFSPKISFALSTLLRIPYVVEINGWVEDEARMQGRPLQMNAWKHGLRHLFLRRTAALVAVTQGLADHVVRKCGLPPDRVHVVSNGADTDLFRPMDRQKARATLGLSMDARVVLFAGNLAPWQGVDVLLKAFAGLRREMSDVFLIIVGDGMEADRLRRLAERLDADRIVFVGRQPHERVPLYIAASDVCVFPGLKERNQRIGVSPIKLAEYASGGRPIVASDVPGAGLLVEKLRIGLSFRADDHVALAERLRDLLEDSQLARDMGLRARDFAVSQLSWKRAAAQVEGIVSHVLSRRRRLKGGSRTGRKLGSRQRHILHVMPYSVRKVGGIAVLVTELAKGLDPSQVRTTIVGPTVTDSAKPLRRDAPYTYREVPLLPVPKTKNLQLAVASFFESLRLRPDVLHVHQPHPQSVGAAMAGRILGCLTLGTFHGLFVGQGGMNIPWLATKQRHLLRRLLDYRVYVSEKTREEYGDKEGRVIHNGVDTDRFRPHPEKRRRVRTALGLEGRFVALFLGRFAVTKGALDVVRALALSREAPVLLVVAGSWDPVDEGTIRHAILETGVASRIRDLGFYTDKTELFAAADAFVLPSYDEGLPLALLEAMSSGLPCIATPVGGVPEVVEHGANGLLVPPGDPEGIAERWTSLLQNKELRKRLGSRARETVQARFSLSQMVEAYGTLYHKDDHPGPDGSVAKRTAVSHVRETGPTR